MDNVTGSAAAEALHEGTDFLSALFGTPLGILIFIILLIIAAFVLYIVIQRFRHRHALKEERRSLKDDLMIWSNLSRMVSGEKGASRGKQNLAANYELIRLVFKTAQDYIKVHCQRKQRTPWYAVLGEPLSGKTSLFGDGTLNTVSLRQEQDPGNTEPLHFHIHRDRVYLDVRGNVFFDNWMGGSSAEWYSICDLIRSSHAVKPLSGIILTIPADALIIDSESITEKKASLIFSEMLRLSRTVRMNLPVRIVITKADCILGFREFFSGITAARKKMTGIDLSSFAQNGGHYNEILFRRAWNKYILALKKTSYGLLLSKKAVDASYTAQGRIDITSGIFSYPEQVNALADTLCHYLRVIFDPDSDTLPGIPEGIYFCSSADQGMCFSAAFAALRHVKTEDAPLSGRHDPLSESLFRDALLGSSLNDLDHRARFTRKEIIRRHVPALAVGIALSLFALNYLAGAVLGNHLITRNLEADTQYYRQMATLFRTHALLDSPLLDVDRETGEGIDRFDSIMTGMTGVTRFNFFASSKLTLLADRPLPLIYAPGSYLFYDYNNLYHDERETIYNQMASDMIFFPAATSFVYNLQHDDSYFTEARADALLDCMHLSLSDADRHVHEKSTDVIQTCLEGIVNAMYPNVSVKAARELSDITDGNQSFAKNAIRQIMLYKDFFPGINTGIRNLVKQLQDVNAYPESDYQSFRAIVKYGSDFITTVKHMRDFARDEGKRDPKAAIADYRELRQEIFYAMNTAELLDRDYANFLNSFSTPLLPEKKGGAGEMETLDLQRLALFDKSHYAYRKLLEDDFQAFIAYIESSSEIGRHLDRSYSDSASLAGFRDRALKNLDQDYQRTKAGLQNIINSNVFNRKAGAGPSQPCNYRIIADLMQIIYVNEDELPVALRKPENFARQFQDLGNIFKSKAANLKEFFEIHKELENTIHIADAAATFLEYEEFLARVHLAENLLKFYPEDGRMATTVAEVAREITAADGDVLGDYIDTASARRALGNFDVDEEYAPRATEILITPLAVLLEYDGKAKGGKDGKKDGAAPRDSGRASVMFASYIQNDPRLKKLQRTVTRYADSFVSYWASFADSIKPAFRDYNGFHEFSKASRAYEINAGLRDIYSMAFDVLSGIHNSVLSANGAASRDHALKVIGARKKLLDLGYNQACTNILNSWALLPEDPIKANRYVSGLSRKAVRNDYTLLMAENGAQNTMPWWDSFVRQGIHLLKSEAGTTVIASLSEFQNRLYYFPVLRNGNTSGQVIPPEDMQKLRKGLMGYGIVKSGPASGNNDGKDAATDTAKLPPEAADEGVDSMQKPLLSGIQAGRDGVAAWAEHVDFILKTFGDTEHPVIAKIAIPDISTQNALLEKVYGKDMASAALRFRYMDVTSGKLPAKRFSSLVTDAPEKVIYEGRADAEGIRFRFFRYSDDKGAEAEIAVKGRYAPLRLYLDENLVHLDEDTENDAAGKDGKDRGQASYVPLKVSSFDGDDSVIFLKIYFSKKMLTPEEWPSAENWPLLSAY